MGNAGKRADEAGVDAVTAEDSPPLSGAHGAIESVRAASDELTDWRPSARKFLESCVERWIEDLEAALGEIGMFALREVAAPFMPRGRYPENFVGLVDASDASAVERFDRARDRSARRWDFYLPEDVRTLGQMSAYARGNRELAWIYPAGHGCFGVAENSDDARAAHPVFRAYQLAEETIEILVLLSFPRLWRVKDDGLRETLRDIVIAPLADSLLMRWFERYMEIYQTSVEDCGVGPFEYFEEMFTGSGSILSPVGWLTVGYSDFSGAPAFSSRIERDGMVFTALQRRKWANLSEEFHALVSALRDEKSTDDQLDRALGIFLARANEIFYPEEHDFDGAFREWPYVSLGGEWEPAERIWEKLAAADRSLLTEAFPIENGTPATLVPADTDGLGNVTADDSEKASFRREGVEKLSSTLGQTLAPFSEAVRSFLSAEGEFPKNFHGIVTVSDSEGFDRAYARFTGKTREDRGWREAREKFLAEDPFLLVDMPGMCGLILNPTLLDELENVAVALDRIAQYAIEGVVISAFSDLHEIDRTAPDFSDQLWKLVVTPSIERACHDWKQYYYSLCASICGYKTDADGDGMSVPCAIGREESVIPVPVAIAKMRTDPDDPDFPMFRLEHDQHRDIGWAMRIFMTHFDDVRQAFEALAAELMADVPLGEERLVRLKSLTHALRAALWEQMPDSVKKDHDLASFDLSAIVRTRWYDDLLIALFADGGTSSDPDSSLTQAVLDGMEEGGMGDDDRSDEGAGLDDMDDAEPSESRYEAGGLATLADFTSARPDTGDYEGGGKASLADFPDYPGKVARILPKTSRIH